METIKAISDTQNVNIIVMNEKGVCNLPNHYNIEADKSLLVLFGPVNGKSCKNNEQRTHYDSIVNIPQQKIASIAKDLSEAEKKHSEFLAEVNTSNILVLK